MCLRINESQLLDIPIRMDATFDEYKEAERFCARYPVEPPKLLQSDVIERLSL